MLLLSGSQGVNKRHRDFGARPATVGTSEKRRNINSADGNNSNNGASLKEPLHTLWVGDLDVWEDEIYLMTLLPTVLPPICPIATVKIVRDNDTGCSLGYGFLDFGVHEIATQALETLRRTARPGRNKRFKVCWAASNTHSRNPTFGHPAAQESFLVRMENHFGPGARVSETAFRSYLQAAGYRTLAAVHLLGDGTFLARFLSAEEAQAASLIANINPSNCGTNSCSNIIGDTNSFNNANPTTPMNQEPPDVFGLQNIALSSLGSLPIPGHSGGIYQPANQPYSTRFDIEGGATYVPDKSDYSSIAENYSGIDVSFNGKNQFFNDLAPGGYGSLAEASYKTPGSTEAFMANLLAAAIRDPFLASIMEKPGRNDAAPPKRLLSLSMSL